jgi:sensor histidine kinase YesM
VFKESFSKKIFTFFSIWVFTNISFFASTLVVNSLFVQDFATSKTIIISIRLFVQAAFLPILYFYFRKPYKNMLEIVPDKTINIMCFYLILGFLLLIYNYDFSSMYFTNIKISLGAVLFILYVVLGYAVVMIAAISVSKNVLLKVEYKVIENQVELQRENYKALSEAIQNIYALRHDARHHILFIKTMIEEKNYDKALEYIRQFNEHEINKTIPTLCENFTADSIIKYYMSIAQEKDIEFKTQLTIPEDININNLDLCIVLGNCLENAIDACDRIIDQRKKYIYFQSKILGSHIVFKITNSFNGEILSFNKGLISTKENRGHGIGLANVQNTVNKYKGSLDFKYSDDEFNVDIVMNIKGTSLT